MFDLRRQLFGRLLQQSVGFFTGSRTGDLLSRMNNDVRSISDVVSDPIFGVVSSLVVALSTLGVMLRLGVMLPRIVILDEATSNLDTLCEQLIQAALRPLFCGRTSFVIAHRLSTILAADVIFVLQDGRLVERGTHHELLARGGLYRTLYEHQFQPHGQLMSAPAAPVAVG